MTTQHNATNVDSNSGFQAGRDAKHQLREERIERILSGQTPVVTDDQDDRDWAPFTTYLDEDGRVDKQRTREERLFGRTPLYV